MIDYPNIPEIRNVYSTYEEWEEAAKPFAVDSMPDEIYNIINIDKHQLQFFWCTRSINTPRVYEIWRSQQNDFICVTYEHSILVDVSFNGEKFTYPVNVYYPK